MHFNLFVIGGGSGGIAAARRAAGYGVKVGIAEFRKWGGTCVNVGCVPKKIMYCAATVAQTIKRDAGHFGFDMPPELPMDWREMCRRRDAHISRLNNIYIRNLDSSNVTHFDAFASFEGRDAQNNKILVNLSAKDNDSVPKRITADNVLIAVGGRPDHLPVVGGEHCINSDQFFELKELPKKTAVIGAGYIAVEMASMLNCFGSEVTLILRKQYPLRQVEEMVGYTLMEEMRKDGMKIVTEGSTERIETKGNKMDIHLVDGRKLEGFTCILAAIGRSSELERLGLEKVHVATTTEGKHIAVDEFQRTSSDGIFAVGDVSSPIAALTPMAIAAGRRLADRLFGGIADAKADYTDVPTVFFTHPTVGTVGMSEKAAKEKYGEAAIKVYTSSFSNLYYSTFENCEKPQTRLKVVTLLPTEKVLGIHIVGMGADEMLQGFAVALKMGATKADLDACVAIHPTAAEDLVTLAPWGLEPRRETFAANPHLRGGQQK